MYFPHGGGEQRHELESLAHLLWTGEGVEAVPEQPLLVPVLCGGEELGAPGVDAASLQEL